VTRVSALECDFRTQVDGMMGFSCYFSIPFPNHTAETDTIRIMASVSAHCCN
jgi:hypothetical protein